MAASLKTIQNDLQAIPLPPTTTTLQPVIDQIEADIEKQFIAMMKSPQLDLAAKNLLLDFDNAILRIEKYRSDVSPVLGVELRTFSDLICKRRAPINALISDFNQNARTQFSDKGAWAMHFSTVRMTIATFLIGISWGVISLKWDDYTPALGVAAIVVWVMAGIFLGIFTNSTCKASEQQKHIKDLFLTAAISTRDSEPKSPTKLLRFLCFSWCPERATSEKGKLSRKRTLLIWLPFYLFIWLTFCFCGLFLCWWLHTPNKKISWTVLVEPDPLPYAFTNQIGTNDVKFHTVEHSPGVTNFEYWARELQNYAQALSTNRSGDVSLDVSGLALNLNSIRDQLRRIADTNSLSREQSPTQFVTLPVDTTRIESGLSNIVISISNLANSMPANLPITNNVNVKIRNSGFLNRDRTKVEIK